MHANRTFALLLRTAAQCHETASGLSKLNSVVFVEVDVVLGEPRSRTTEVIKRVRRLPKRELRIP